jgi:hypothetical protein
MQEATCLVDYMEYIPEPLAPRQQVDRLKLLQDVQNDLT